MFFLLRNVSVFFMFRIMSLLHQLMIKKCKKWGEKGGGYKLKPRSYLGVYNISKRRLFSIFMLCKTDSSLISH